MTRPDASDRTQSVGGDLLARDSDPQLRVLVVGVSWPMETFVERLLVGLARAGVQITLAPARVVEHPPREWLSLHGIRWTDELVTATLRNALEAVQRGDVPLAGAMARGALRRAGEVPAIDGRWDVVYGPWINTFTDHLELLDLAAPIVTSCRGSLVTIAPWNPDRTVHRERLADVFESARLVHCVSDAIVGDAADLGLERSKARVIRPAVDSQAFLAKGAASASEGPVRVIGVGTLIWGKDYEHALVAIRKGIDAGADLRLDLVGDGTDRQHLQFAIDDLGLGDRVRLLGRRPPAEVAALLQGADVFLHTSCSEGISNAVLEAMATGLPVVTTDVGGMAEAVRDGIDGYLVPVRDSDATAAALVRLAGDPELRAQMGAAGRERVMTDYRLDDQITAFVALLHEAAGR